MIPEPKNYYQGVDLNDRPLCKNVLLFERLTLQALQQRQLSNRMHHRYVLMQVQETGGVVNVDGVNISLKAEDALLLAPFQFHHFVETDAKNIRWLFVTFELQQGERLLARLCHRKICCTSGVKDVFHRMTDAWIQSNEWTRCEVLSLLDLLLLRILRSGNPEMLDVGKRVAFIEETSWVARVEALIIRSIDEGWTMSEVARQIGLSERRMRSRFEVATGLSLREYRDHYQLHRTIALMRDPDISLGDIAALCGFNSHPVFSKFIKRKTNLSPRALRKTVLSGDYIA